MKDLEGHEIQINPKLNENMKNYCYKKINEFLPMFTQEPDKIEVAKCTPQVLKINSDVSIVKRNYHLAFRERKELIKLINQLESAGVIKKQKSKYESPVFLKKKPDGTYRLLVDYRQVNKIIEKDTNRVPVIETFWPHLRNMKFFTQLDLNSGYFQIPLEEKSKELTGISIDGKGYVFNSLPQGMSTSPSMFQTVMMETLQPLLWKKVICYLDDICVFGKTEKECIDNTIEVLEILNEKGFKLKTKKCKFFYDEIELLGNHIKNNKLTPLNKHLKAIENLKRPETYKQLRSIVGTLSYQRKRIRNFSQKILPLTNILKGVDSKYNGKLKNWTNEHEKCFQNIKKLMLENPFLKIFNPNAYNYIEVDASAYAIGAILGQIDPQTHEKYIIGYFSEKLPENKRHLCSFDLEMLAITRACQFFRYYLLGQKFTIYTDHQPLTFQHRYSTPSPRLSRLISKLGEFNFNIKHISGKNNILADFLSRYPTDAIVFEEGQFKNSKEIDDACKKEVKIVTRSKQKESNEELQFYQKKKNKPRKKANNYENENSEHVSNQTLPILDEQINVSQKIIENKNLENTKILRNQHDENKKEVKVEQLIDIDEPTSITPHSEPNKEKIEKKENVISLENFKSMQRNDSCLKLLVDALKYKNWKKSLENGIRKKLKATRDLYYLNQQGILFRKRNDKTQLKDAVPVVPQELIKTILKEFHDSDKDGGHFGNKKTFEKIRKKFYFENMRKIVRDYVRSCHECQINQKNPKVMGKMKPITVEKFEPFGHIEIDYIGPMNVKFQKKYISVCVDKNTNFCIIKPSIAPNSETVIKLLKFIERNYNLPRKISCDNGTHFNNELVKNYCQKNKINLVFASSYSPQSQGLVERINGVIKNCLKKYNPKTNDEWIDTLENIVANYNSSPIEQFKNKSPFYLIHGYEKISNIERNLGKIIPPENETRDEQIKNVENDREEMPKLIEKAGQKNKKYYDKNKLTNNFEPNSLVLIRQGKNLPNAKLKYEGPYRVLDQLGELTYLVKIGEKIEQIHSRRMINYYEREDCESKIIPPPLDLQNELQKLGTLIENKDKSANEIFSCANNPEPEFETCRKNQILEKIVTIEDDSDLECEKCNDDIDYIQDINEIQ